MQSNEVDGKARSTRGTTSQIPNPKQIPKIQNKSKSQKDTCDLEIEELEFASCLHARQGLAY